MNSLGPRRQELTSTSVTLPAQQWTQYTDSQYEPQYTTSKKPNRGWVYITSKDSPESDKTVCTVYPKTQLGTGFNRINIEGFTVNWFIPNVNPRNNWIHLLSSNYPTTPFSLYLDVKYWTSSLDLVNHIRDQLNAVAGTGLTFSVVTSAADPDLDDMPDYYALVASGGTFMFLDDSTVITKGEPCFGIAGGQSLAAKQTIGPMGMMYTQYVDIQSQTLTQWTKIQSATSSNVSAIVARAYVGGKEYGTQFQRFDDDVSLSWNPITPLSSIDISLFDSSGDPLYAPENGSKLSWQLAMAIEL